VLRGCIIFFICKEIILFGFDKTWSFLMAEGSWRIHRKCIMHLHKLCVISYLPTSGSVSIVMRSNEMLPSSCYFVLLFLPLGIFFEHYFINILSLFVSIY